MTVEADNIRSDDSVALSEQRRDEIFEREIRPERFANLQPVSNPRVFFLGGQPGAGKTALQRHLEKPLPASGIAEVGPDLFRSYHPRYHELVQLDDQRTSFHTNADAGAWVERAIRLTQTAGSHVMLEGTLRNPEITIETARGYAARGFDTELHVPVVHEFVSRLYIIRRFLGQITENGVGRFTIRTAHQSAYSKLPESLEIIDASGVMERVVLHDPRSAMPYEIVRGTGGSSERVRTLLAEVRERPHLPPETILAELDALERDATKFARKECLDDIRALRSDVGSFGDG